MHVTRLDVQGFKTFAKKTTLTFLDPKNNRFPITAIVGPNGSGKSNLADAIRWVLGEQSLKLLRGKKSEDVIFSGSDEKSRSGFAEVSITFNNADRTMPIDFKEVKITRRLYRDSTSEYLLNEAKTRLGDIHLLLAQANVGQRSYSVIAQGMIDHILVSTPEERKAFFDDATGVKQFQLKRHDAVLKLKRTYENLADVEMVLSEIEPRLRSLKRQASRLEKRDSVETELRKLEHDYYGTLWWELSDKSDALKKDQIAINKKLTDNKKELVEFEKKTELVEQADTQDEGLIKLQSAYRKNQHERDQNRQEQFKTEKEIELTKVRAQSHWAPLPLLKIISEVKAFIKGLRLIKGLKDTDAAGAEIAKLLKQSEGLASRLERPNPKDIKPDPALVKELKNLREIEKGIVSALKKLEDDIDNYAKKEQKVRSDLIQTQRGLRTKQAEIHELENKKNGLDIEQARFEERRSGLVREMDEFMKEAGGALRRKRPPFQEGPQGVAVESIYPDIQRLRYKLELIGGIDPEIIKEYEETKERFDFLDGQTKDLQKAIRAIEKIIGELDGKIEKQSKKVFAQINKQFDHYFKLLFEGGTASLVKLTRDDLDEPVGEGVTPDRSFEDTGEAERDKQDQVRTKINKHQDPVIGVDIQATPPGKRLKSLNLLSGGERALTSIALLSAIMAVNPSPFVVLDEVDAALDEANTYRYAAIIEELSERSQFIIITHNRATMEKADVLYGVTMGKEGISNLLSLHMEDTEKKIHSKSKCSGRLQPSSTYDI